MKVVLTNPANAVTCTWCEKEREGVTASFSDRFLIDAPICWRCLATAVKVRARHSEPTKDTARQADVAAKE